MSMYVGMSKNNDVMRIFTISLGDLENVIHSHGIPARFAKFALHQLRLHRQIVASPMISLCKFKKHLKVIQYWPFNMNILKCKFLKSLSGAYGLIYILKTPSSDCTNSHYIISSPLTNPRHLRTFYGHHLPFP